MILLILLLGFYIEFNFSPRVSWIDESSMLLLYYTYKNNRKYFILWK